MKKLGLALVLLVSVFTHAQVSINVNIGTPPSWGPEGYDDSRYYYLPDIDVYYDVNNSQYIYDNNGVWVREKRIPARYRNYDLYSGYKVVLNDYRGDKPYSYHSKHRAAYPKGYVGKPQKNRGPKPDKKSKPEGNHKSNNGNGNGNGNGKNKGNSKKDQTHSHGNDRR
ncbi:hypothetical protein [Flavobacterium reichenbachii]|uniref:hypothetical protein n=1 Tax=Flavobacterium reichenbachii TaxID=362418 RepID=UPI00054F0A7C|nr:hypothetical protein [Flavobacterium reichenbachii]OXB15695.1 hypothetical protein B0A68_09910 [Flavobacterium reichenbachii]